MGSVLLGIVARRNRDDKPSSDLNNNSEIGECALEKEVHLFESPPLGIKQQVNFKPDLVTQKAVKIGKFAKITERKEIGDHFLDYKVSESSKLSYHLWSRTIDFN